MTISFATLLLGLVFGVRPVAVMVAPEVRSVELRVDGKLAGHGEGPPWTIACDLGPEPRPHELVAIAFDARGREIGRAAQWVNLPRPESEARLLLETDAHGAVTGARVSWEHITRPQPRSVHATLDGRRLRIDGNRIEVPATDPGESHVLAVEVRFDEEESAFAHAAFGGGLIGGAEAELTAVPIEIAPGRTAPTATELAGRITVAGRPARVIAVEDAPAEVVLVLERELTRRFAARRRALARVPHQLALTPAEESDDRFSFLLTTPERRQHGNEIRRLFSVGPPYALDRLDLHDLLAAVRFPSKGEEDASAAVCMAGIRASARNRPRAVVLVLGGEAPVGAIGAQAARRFLTDLHVPFEVWTAAEQAAEQAAEWGDAAPVLKREAARRAAQALQTRLDRQRIVWIEGRHLPQRIALEPVPGIRLAE